MSILRMSLGAALLAAASTFTALPAAAVAATSATAAQAWEFYDPRPRQFSLTRKPVPTIAVEFAGQRIPANAGWSELSEAQRTAVMAIQKRSSDGAPASGPSADTTVEPPFPRLGLSPLMERLHRVRGPVNEPLRLHLGIDALGRVEAISTDIPVTSLFLNDLLQTLVNSGYKPARCGDKNCAGTLTLDIVYLGS